MVLGPVEPHHLPQGQLVFLEQLLLPSFALQVKLPVAVVLGLMLLLTVRPGLNFVEVVDLHRRLQTVPVELGLAEEYSRYLVDWRLGQLDPN